MKKFFFFLMGAGLMLASCNHSATVIEEHQASSLVAFKAGVNQATRAGELTGSILPNTFGIYVAATQKNANGLIENPTFFNSPFEQLFGTIEDDPAAAGPDTRLWHAGEFWDDDDDAETPNVYRNAPIYWPIGSVKMDFLAYAMPIADHNETLAVAAEGSTISPDASQPANTGADWAACWDKQHTDIASQFTFYDVDTYVNQVDVLYAKANGQSNVDNGGSGKSVAMAFEHAQSLLIFNVKINEAASGKIAIDEIGFYTPARVDAMRADQVSVAAGNAAALADLTDADVTLKTFGTFRVDNSRNDLQAYWSFGKNRAGADVSATRKENYKMPNSTWPSAKAAAFAAIDADDTNYPTESDKDDAKDEWLENNPASVSASNSTVLGQASQTVQGYADAIPFITGGLYAQLGESLLIPEQEKMNFTISYTVGGKKFFYTFNDLRGVWEMGKKYIYNLDLTMNEIVITESVADFVAQPMPTTLN